MAETQRPKLFNAIANLNSQLARRGVNLRALKSTARAMIAGREGASLQELRAARREMQTLVRQLERGQKFAEQKIAGIKQRIFSAAFLALFGGVALDRMLQEEPQNEDLIASTAEETIPDAAAAWVTENPPVAFAPPPIVRQKDRHASFLPPALTPAPHEIPARGEFPSETPEFLKPAIGRLEHFGLQPNQYGLVVDVHSQTLFLVRDRQIAKTYRISTGKKGLGLTAGRTPPGMHKVDRRAGANREIGERVKDGTRLPIFTDSTEETHARPSNIVTRALYLEGLERDNGDAALRRGVAIHGTDHENLIGQPASHGCVRMRNTDVIELFDLIPADTLVEISENA